jgi:hypothetical protein
MHDSRHPAPSRFHMNPGDRITGSFLPDAAGCDRVFQEIANCSYCLRPTYKVLVITSAAGLERRAALCVNHFAAAAKTFPEVKQRSA